MLVKNQPNPLKCVTQHLEVFKQDLLQFKVVGEQLHLSVEPVNIFAS